MGELRKSDDGAGALALGGSLMAGDSGDGRAMAATPVATHVSFPLHKHLAQRGLLVRICGVRALVALLGKDRTDLLHAASESLMTANE